MSSRKERTGWRDQALSEKHREWGYDLPMVDLDFLCLEYAGGGKLKLAALIDYKAGLERGVDNWADSIYLVQHQLAEKAGLPFFIVKYDAREWYFLIHPVNALARLFCNEGQRMSETAYRAFLQSLRRRESDEF